MRATLAAGVRQRTRASRRRGPARALEFAARACPRSITNIPAFHRNFPDCTIWRASAGGGFSTKRSTLNPRPPRGRSADSRSRSRAVVGVTPITTTARRVAASSIALPIVRRKPSAVSRSGRQASPQPRPSPARCAIIAHAVGDRDRGAAPGGLDDQVAGGSSPRSAAETRRADRPRPARRSARARSAARPRDRVVEQRGLAVDRKKRLGTARRGSPARSACHRPPAMIDARVGSARCVTSDSRQYS